MLTENKTVFLKRTLLTLVILTFFGVATFLLYTYRTKQNITNVSTPVATTTEKIPRVTISASQPKEPASYPETLESYEDKVVALWFIEYPTLVTKNSVEPAKNETGYSIVLDCDAAEKPLSSGYIIFKCSPDLKTEKVALRYNPITNSLIPFEGEVPKSMKFIASDYFSTASTKEGAFSILPGTLFFKPVGSGATTTVKQNNVKGEGSFKMVRAYSHTKI